MTENINQPEEMAAFFDQRAAGYDRHMFSSLEEAAVYYRSLAAPIKPTKAPLAILDLGCGTGLEIPALLEAAPGARLTCLDLSRAMLASLREKYPRQETMRLIQASYLELDFGRELFDVILSSMTFHHLLPEAKQSLYQRIFNALKPGGSYIEGDYIVSVEKMNRLLAEFRCMPAAYQEGGHHIDIPLSLDIQKALLRAAGFTSIDVVYQRGENVILTALKPMKADRYAGL